MNFLTLPAFFTGKVRFCLILGIVFFLKLLLVNSAFAESTTLWIIKSGPQCGVSGSSPCTEGANFQVILDVSGPTSVSPGQEYTLTAQGQCDGDDWSGQVEVGGGIQSGPQFPGTAPIQCPVGTRLPAGSVTLTAPTTPGEHCVTYFVQGRKIAPPRAGDYLVQRTVTDQHCITVGSSEPSEPSEPNRPNASAGSCGTDSIQVTWQNVSGATGYDLQYRRGSGSWNLISNVTSPRTISGLTPGASYTFQLRAKNSEGNSSWSPFETELAPDECAPTTYSCTGSIPSNASRHDSEEESSLTQNYSWQHSASDGSRKCQYECNSGYNWSGSSCVRSTAPTTYQCTGTQPGNTNLCPGDNTGLTSDTSRTLVNSCTTGRKCEYVCQSGYLNFGTICVEDWDDPPSPPSGPSCTPDPNSWDPPASSRCTDEYFLQDNNCGDWQYVYGKQDCTPDACVPKTTPDIDPATVCANDSWSEDDGCGGTVSFTGTGSCPAPNSAVADLRANSGQDDIEVSDGEDFILSWICEDSSHGMLRGDGITDTNPSSPTFGRVGRATVSTRGNMTVNASAIEDASERYRLDCYASDPDGDNDSEQITVSVAGKEPNLAFAAYSVDLGELQLDGTYDTARINFVATNNGNGNVPRVSLARVRIFGTSRSVSVEDLDVGRDSDVESADFSSVAPGSLVTIALDDTDVIDELDETDNVLTFTIDEPVLEDPSLSISVSPPIVRPNQTAELSWDATAPYPMECTVKGPTISPAIRDDTDPYQGTTTVGPITAKSVFLLTCTEPNSGSEWSESVELETLGTVEEV